MKRRPPIVALIAFFIGACLLVQGSAPAQQAVPDAPQPQKDAQQPQKKAAPKPPPDTPPANTDNAFPEAQSQAAASQQSTPSKDDNAFPEAASKAAADAAAQQAAQDKKQDNPSPRSSTAQDNPFPEAVSKAAAKSAGNEPAPAKADVPAGMSSSQARPDDIEAGAGEITQDPARSKNDDQVGSFYLQTGDLKGALARYQDATAADPTNVDAIFGLAEAQRLLGKKADAAREYQMYLAIVPHGPKAKEATRALKSLASK